MSIETSLPASGTCKVRLTSPEGENEHAFEIGYGAYRATATGLWPFRRLNTIELKVRSQEESLPADFWDLHPSERFKEPTLCLHLGMARLSARPNTEKSIVIESASSQPDAPLIWLRYAIQDFCWQGACRLEWRRNAAHAIEFQVEAAFVARDKRRLKLALQATPGHFRPPSPTEWAFKEIVTAAEAKERTGEAVRGWWAPLAAHRQVVMGYRPGRGGNASRMLVDRDFAARFEDEPLPHLSLNDNPCITDGVFAYLKPVAHCFDRLSIDRTAIDGRRFDLLAGWPKLLRIEANRTRVNDANIGALRECRSLQVAEFTGTALTEQGYESVRAVCRNLPDLRVFLLDGTGLSEECLLKLDDEFPKIRFWSK